MRQSLYEVFEALSLLNFHAYPNHTTALRRHATRPEEALAMIHAPLGEK